MEETQQALAYFASQGIQAFEDDGSIYVESSLPGTFVQISTAEIIYRAELNN